MPPPRGKHDNAVMIIPKHSLNEENEAGYALLFILTPKQDLCYSYQGLLLHLYSEVSTRYLSLP